MSSLQSDGYTATSIQRRRRCLARCDTEPTAESADRNARDVLACGSRASAAVARRCTRNRASGSATDRRTHIRSLRVRSTHMPRAYPGTGPDTTAPKEP